MRKLRESFPSLLLLLSCGERLEAELVLMATAGHRSVQTTLEYLHLAGRSFPTAAAALEDRLLAGGFSTEPSTNLTAPEPV